MTERHLLPAGESPTLVDLLRWRAEHPPEQGGYRFVDDRGAEKAWLDYPTLDRRARSIGACLREMAEPGQRALLVYPPGLEFVVAFFGCLYAGLIAVPAYPPRPNRTLDALQAIVRDARPRLALTTGALLPGIERQLPAAPELVEPSWLATDELEAGATGQWRRPAVDGESLALLQYTSGSTTAPKGVMVSHANLLHNLAVIREAFGHTADSRGVIWLPPYHDMGLVGGILQPLYLGCETVLMSPLSFLQRPLRWLQAIARHRATTSGGPDFAYRLCVERTTPEQRAELDLSSWQVAFTGAEPIRAETLDRFADAFAPCGFRRESFYPCYGLAESTLLVVGAELGAGPRVHRCSAEALAADRLAPVEDGRELVGCGRPWGGQRVEIVDPVSRRACPTGQIGEIWVAGPSVARGYWDEPAGTERTFRARLADSGEGPFLRTGDLGGLIGGDLVVTGRLKDLMVVDGRNHYPQDIERTVERSHPSLRPGGCAAFSVGVDGREQPLVAVEAGRHLGSDRAPDAGAAQLDTLVRAIRRSVAEQHDLQLYAVVLLESGALPRTSSGKVRRSACRDGFLAGTLECLESAPVGAMARSAPMTGTLGRGHAAD